MAILAIYLTPNRVSSTTKRVFGAAQQVDKLSQMDWCNFTASYLFEGIKEYKQSNKPLIKVKGCVHILSVIFIDLVKIGALKIPGGFPRIGIVTTRHNKLATSCSHPFRDYQVRHLEESVYASLLDKIPKDNIIEGRKCADSDTNTDAGTDQFGTNVEDTTCNSTKLMETCHYSRATRSHEEVTVHYSRATRSHKEPEDPLDHGRSILGASQKEHLVSAELGSATSSPNTLSLAIVEAPELDTSTPSAVPSLSAESASHEDTHTRHKTLDISANADSTRHHFVEQEHINFPRDGQQLQSNGPSSKPYAAQIAEGMQVAPDVSLGRNRASPSTMEEGCRTAKKARVEQPSGYVQPAGVGAVVDTSLLNCPLCSRPFKPPVFQCKSGHLACGTCIAELPVIRCQKCEHGGAFDVHNMMMDTIVLSAKVKCSHGGCQSYVSYHELDDHHSTRACARVHPATAPSLAAALSAFRWRSSATSQLSTPGLSTASSTSRATAVSAVRLGASSAQPRYMLNILAYLPPVVAGRRAHMLLLDMDVESSTRPGEVVVEELSSYLTVPPVKCTRTSRVLVQ
ncbi:uncharacterized protein [Lolium perenne]|uniref:uncharacterized protein n=1 Tax=Lolium perenne TaxID=4522 RepID=UPI0021F55A3A|nr:uncharacterized protein LOC127339186 [Lolium perenne]